MNVAAFSGWTHSARGASVPVGYSVGVSFAEHIYTGMEFAANLGPFEGIGNDADGNPTKALDAGILIAADFGYEEVIDDAWLVRGTLGVGGYFWSRQNDPNDYNNRIHANGFVVVPSVLVAKLFGPVLLGVQSQGIVGTVAMDRWSYGGLLVVGAHFDLR